MNVEALSWFSAVLFPIHEIVSPLDSCQLVGAKAEGAAVTVRSDRFVFTKLSELIGRERERERESNEQSRLIRDIFQLAWRSLSARTGSNALHVSEPDSPGGRRSRVGKKTNLLAPKGQEILTQNGDHLL